MSLDEANLRLVKAGGDVCRALGVYAEDPRASVVNELVLAAQKQAAERIRAACDVSCNPYYCTHDDLADLIDPEVKS